MRSVGVFLFALKVSVSLAQVVAYLDTVSHFIPYEICKLGFTGDTLWFVLAGEAHKQGGINVPVAVVYRYHSDTLFADTFYELFTGKYAGEVEWVSCAEGNNMVFVTWVGRYLDTFPVYGASIVERDAAVNLPPVSLDSIVSYFPHAGSLSWAEAVLSDVYSVDSGYVSLVSERIMDTLLARWERLIYIYHGLDGVVEAVDVTPWHQGATFGVLHSYMYGSNKYFHTGTRIRKLSATPELMVYGGFFGSIIIDSSFTVNCPYYCGWILAKHPLGTSDKFNWLVRLWGRGKGVDARIYVIVSDVVEISKDIVRIFFDSGVEWSVYPVDSAVIYLTFYSGNIQVSETLQVSMGAHSIDLDVSSGKFFDLRLWNEGSAGPQIIHFWTDFLFYWAANVIDSMQVNSEWLYENSAFFFREAGMNVRKDLGIIVKTVPALPGAGRNYTGFRIRDVVNFSGIQVGLAFAYGKDWEVVEARYGTRVKILPLSLNKRLIGAFEPVSNLAGSSGYLVFIAGCPHVKDTMQLLTDAGVIQQECNVLVLEDRIPVQYVDSVVVERDESSQVWLVSIVFRDGCSVAPVTIPYSIDTLRFFLDYSCGNISVMGYDTLSGFFYLVYEGDTLMLADSASFWVDSSGAYWVVYVDSSGCEVGYSDTIIVARFAGGAPLQVYYLDGLLHVLAAEKPSTIRIAALRGDYIGEGIFAGELIHQQFACGDRSLRHFIYHVGRLIPGIYVVEVTSAGGVSFYRKIAVR